MAAYNRVTDPDALPAFAEPERPGKKDRRQEEPPVPGIRHANTTYDRAMSGLGPSRQNFVSPHQGYSSSLGGSPQPARQDTSPLPSSAAQFSGSQFTGRPSPQFPGPSRPSPQASGSSPAPRQSQFPTQSPHLASSSKQGSNAQVAMPSSPNPDKELAKQLMPLFLAVDVDRTGHLSERELGTALVNGDFSYFDPPTVRMMIRMFDSDRSGTIDFDEFCGLWSFLSQWRTLFDRFDQDRSGQISLLEFDEALKAFRYRVTQNFTELLFNRFDKHRTSQLSFDLFVQASITLKRMTDTFKKFDDDRDGYITLSFEDYLSETLKMMS